MPAGSTIRCPSCGSATAATEGFCRRCGNDLAAGAGLALLGGRDDAERTEVIPAYGSSGSPPAPGAPAARAPAPAGAAVPRGRRRRVAGVLVAVLGLGLLGVGGYAGYRAVADGRTSPPSASGAAGPSAGPGTGAGPGTSAGVGQPTATPGPSQAPLVAAAPALAERPETGEVVRLLTAYFDAINTRDFAAARKTLINRPGLPQSEAEFQDRYRSTHDRDVRLLGLQPTGDGGYIASVSFTSFQNPADAPDQTSACLIWSMAYPLARVDGTLLIDAVRRSGVAYHRC